MQHAKLSPSSSARWTVCAASVKANEQYENKGNSASEWGTKCHDLGEKMLKEELYTCDDPEMEEVASEYANYCNDLAHGKTLVTELIEETFSLGFISPNQFGTSDYTAVIDTTLHVVDLKTGHNLVNVKDNSQLMLYALGALHELEDLYDIDKVTLHIVQPRLNYFDSWDIDVDELREWGEWVKGRAELALSDNPPYQPDTYACKWCAHQANCEALREHTFKVIKGDFDNLDDIDGKADKIPLEHVKLVLDNADLIRGFIAAVEERALELANAGEQIEGYKLVEARTNRKWSDEKEVEKLLAGKDIYVKKLKPMTALLKEFKGVEGLEELLIKPQGVATLVPLSDKREPIQNICDSFDKL